LVAAHVRLVQGHDAAELVKIRYNFRSFLHLISDHRFRSFTATADTYALMASYDVSGVTLRERISNRGGLTARERAIHHCGTRDTM
jgi:hypothetical protein